MEKKFNWTPVLFLLGLLLFVSGSIGRDKKLKEDSKQSEIIGSYFNSGSGWMVMIGIIILVVWHERITKKS